MTSSNKHTHFFFKRINWIKVFAIGLTPVFGIVYGFGEFYGWWDSITGRKTIIECYERLIHGNGYPKGFIYADEKEFETLELYLKKHTSNKLINKLSEEGHDPTLIAADGGDAKKWSTPKDWPTALTIPMEAQIMFVYGMVRNDHEIDQGNTTWVGSLYELKNWIDLDLERQRFLFSVVLTSVLAIGVGILDSINKKNRP